MAETKLLAGHPVRRLRRQQGLTQAAMAEALAISPSYLNLIERNQRPLPAALLVRLIDTYGFDPRTLAAGEPGGGAAAVRRRLSDPMFGDLEIDRAELQEWFAAAPGGVEAFARAFDRSGAAGPAPASDDPTIAVRREIERWRNHFADLDAAAEALADELRLAGADLYGALVERLRVKHGLSIRVLPVDVLSDVLRRVDLHARQLQLSELLPAPSRTFALAAQIGGLEARGEIDALVRGAAFAERGAERLYRRHLVHAFAGALVMPYGRFLRAGEATGYDWALLAHRFGASLEQVAHRLTTLGRVGARGLPFFVVRIDRAGQTSKRFAGAGDGSPADTDARCPLWRIHHAFDRRGEIQIQLIEQEDGRRWLTQSHAAAGGVAMPGGVAAEFAVGIGVPAEQAAALAAARGVDLAGRATAIGPGCRACLRQDCPQRAAPPAHRTLTLGERERRVSPFAFAGD